MAKKEIEAVEESVEETAPPATGRQKRWEAFLEAAQKQNPAKFAIKEAAGEFKKIPDSFE